MQPWIADISINHRAGDLRREAADENQARNFISATSGGSTSIVRRAIEALSRRSGFTRAVARAATASIR